MKSGPIKEKGLSTKVVGPPAWIFMHSIAQRYSRDPKNPTVIEKQHAKQFYSSIETLFPCGVCRDSYSIYLQLLPIDFFLNSRRDLILWVYTIHNFVNYKLMKQGQTIEIPTLQDIYRKYESFTTTPSHR